MQSQNDTRDQVNYCFASAPAFSETCRLNCHHRLLAVTCHGRSAVDFPSVPVPVHVRQGPPENQLSAEEASLLKSNLSSNE